MHGTRPLLDDPPVTTGIHHALPSSRVEENGEAYTGAANSTSALRKMANPCVSVVIPVFNAAAYVKETIDSALKQTYQHIEIVVVDDGSSDGSLALLRSYEPRIKVLSQANGGVSVARNRGVRESSGDILAFLDADDLWDPAKIERQISVLTRYPGALAVYCDHRIIDAEGNITGPSGALAQPRTSGQLLRNLLLGNFIISPSLMILRRTAFQQVGGFDESMRVTGDYDLWMRIAATGPILYMLDTLVSYRRHGRNMFTGESLELHLDTLRSLAKIRPYVERSKNASLREVLHQAKYNKLMSIAWHHDLKGQHGQAIRRYIDAVRANPLSIAPILGVSKSILRYLRGLTSFGYR